MAKVNKIVLAIFLLVLVSTLASASGFDEGVIFQTDNGVSYYTNTSYNFTTIIVYSDSLFIDGGKLTIYPVSSANITLDSLYSRFDFSNNITLTSLSLENGFANFAINNRAAYKLSLIDSTWSQDAIASSNKIIFYSILPNSYYIALSSITPSLAFHTVCSSDSDLLPTIMKVFSVGLLVFAFGIVFIQLRTEQPNSTIIVMGIITAVVGFAMLLLGNYLLYSIMEVTGC